MLDEGATISLVAASISRKIGLRGVSADMVIRGVGNGELRGRCERVEFSLIGAFTERKIEHAIVIPSLDLPSQSLSGEITRSVFEQEGIKISPYDNERISILIGQDNWPLLHSIEVRAINNSGLVASKTVLGWSVHGFIADKRRGGKTTVIHTAHANQSEIEEKTQNNERLEELIEYYFKLENLGVSDFHAKIAYPDFHRHERNKFWKKRVKRLVKRVKRDFCGIRMLSRPSIVKSPRRKGYFR